MGLRASVFRVSGSEGTGFIRFYKVARVYMFRLSVLCSGGVFQGLGVYKGFRDWGFKGLVVPRRLAGGDRVKGFVGLPV